MALLTQWLVQSHYLDYGPCLDSITPPPCPIFTPAVLGVGSSLCIIIHNQLFVVTIKEGDYDVKKVRLENCGPTAHEN